MRTRLWFPVLLMLVAACGQGVAETTITQASVAGPDLSGVSLEVHSAPG